MFSLNVYICVKCKSFHELSNTITAVHNAEVFILLSFYVPPFHLEDDFFFFPKLK